MEMKTLLVLEVLVQSSMIICDARTGSNLLGYSLGKHGEVKYGDEILSESINSIPPVLKMYASKTFDIYSYNRLGREKRKLLATPDYMDFAFKHFNLVKLLYYHIETKEPIDYISNFYGKIIHLKRRSYLDKCISWFVAQRDNGFLYLHRPPKKKPIHIDIQKLDYYLNRMIAQEKMWDNILTGHNVKTVYYSELVNEWETTLLSCQSFLNIQRKIMSQKTCRAISKPHLDLVINKREVLDYMKDYEEYV